MGALCLFMNVFIVHLDADVTVKQWFGVMSDYISLLRKENERVVYTIDQIADTQLALTEWHHNLTFTFIQLVLAVGLLFGLNSLVLLFPDSIRQACLAGLWLELV